MRFGNVYFASIRSLDYFGEVLESGAHLNSLQMLLDGQADVTAIDSTVLDYEMRRQPALARKLRVLETLGPSPIPPWVISPQLPKELRYWLRELLLAMYLGSKGQAVLADGELSGFVPTTDIDYQLIRGQKGSPGSAKGLICCDRPGDGPSGDG